MDASTRPPQKRHQVSRHLAGSLMALCVWSTSAALANAPLLDKSQSNSTSEATAPAAHDMAIATVKPGEEGLELSARFSENGTENVNGVEWLITNESGDKVFDGLTAVAVAKLPPGAYQVAANYGQAHIVQGLTVHEGTKLIISFVLNAGGLRVLPRVKNLGLPKVPSESKVYALSGTAKGQLITTSFTPGEVMKVSAGDYRIESHFENGNAVAITDVHVRPGIMSAVNIDHVAGLATLELSGANVADVAWTVSDENAAVSFTSKSNLSLVLKPGHYIAQAEISGQKYTEEFDISAGKTSTVIVQTQ